MAKVCNNTFSNAGGGITCNYQQPAKTKPDLKTEYDDADDLKIGEIIQYQPIGKLAVEKIAKVIMKSDMLCRENVKTSPKGQYIVPPAVLDYQSNLVDFRPGHTDNPADAQEVYDSLVTLTKWLLKVGFYSYHEYRRCTGYGYTQDNDWYDSGIALFTDEYSATAPKSVDGKGIISSNGGSGSNPWDDSRPAPYSDYECHANAADCHNASACNSNTPPTGSTDPLELTPMPDRGGVVKTELISVESINTLVSNCLNSWKTSKKPVHQKTYSYCHSSCHSSCHNEHKNTCHNNCDNSCDGSCDSGHHGDDCHNSGHTENRPWGCFCDNSSGYNNTHHTPPT